MLGLEFEWDTAKTVQDIGNIVCLLKFSATHSL